MENLRAALAARLAVAAATLILIANLLGIPASGAEPGASEVGVFDNRILFGQSAALEGSAAALGLGMREGILAAFNEVNAAGGVKGRRLELVSRNDGYEPDKAIENTNQLLKVDQVFALIGEVGTPTSKAAQPIATAAGVPFQDDSFGLAGRAGVLTALEKRSMALVAEGTYVRNTTAVKTAFLTIRKAAPQAVGMVGTYAACAEFIRLARRLGLDAVFVNISFVGSNSLAKELGSDGKGVVISQVVPFPGDATVPVVARYQKALRAAAPEAEFGFVSLEGYLVGRLVAEALSSLDGPVTRAGLLAAIKERGTFDLGGITLTYGPNKNQGMDRVFLTVIQADGSIRAVDRLAE